MSKRPYFKSSIEDLESQFSSAKADSAVLHQIQKELTYRNRPRARALKVQVEKQLKQQADHISTTEIGSCGDESPITRHSVPDRVVVECAHCKTLNFVSTLEGVIQNISCSACKAPFEVQFKYGVLRTTFSSAKENAPVSSKKWILAILAVLVVLMFLLKN